MIGKEEKAAVLRVLDSGILSGFKGNWSEDFYGGHEVKSLEKEWAEYFGVKHVIAVNSATSGLWAACAAIGLKPPCQQYYDRHMDEVIVSPYSMTCSASIPLHFGAKPVFADIEEDYYCLDPKSVEERITERTKAIIVVDLFGQPYDADVINEIAERKGNEYDHKIYVIEDAAQAAGAKYKGRYAGTLGDIGVYSLNVHKPIQCGEGGVVVTNDDDLAFRLRLCMNHSEAVMNDLQNKVYKPMGNTDWVRLDKLDEDNLFEQGIDVNDVTIWSLVGMNLRMTELSAAIAREQLKKLDGIIKIQQKYAEYFPVKVRPECEHSFYRYAFTIESKAPQIDMFLYKKMMRDKINIKHHYIKPIYQMPLFKSLGYEDGLCPVCEQVDENIVLAWLKEVL